MSLPENSLGLFARNALGAQVDQHDMAFGTPGDDAQFARQLFETCNVTVLPGSFLAREAHQVNPGRGFARVALVAAPAQCLEGARRLAQFYTRFA